MKFADVVQNGVLQAHGDMERGPQRKGLRLPGPSRQQRLLEYKGERIERSLIRWMKQGHTPQIIWG